MADDLIEVEVAYALPHLQYLIRVKLPPKSQVLTAIKSSSLLGLCPDIDLTRQRVGIFSKFVALTDEVNSGDRVEIYRPLVIDPKAARRIRAAGNKKPVR